jgi:hypothetical protein
MEAEEGCVGPYTTGDFTGDEPQFARFNQWDIDLPIRQYVSKKNIEWCSTHKRIRDPEMIAKLAQREIAREQYKLKEAKLLEQLRARDEKEEEEEKEKEKNVLYRVKKHVEGKHEDLNYFYNNYCHETELFKKDDMATFISYIKKFIKDPIILELLEPQLETPGEDYNEALKFIQKIYMCLLKQLNDFKKMNKKSLEEVDDDIIINQDKLTSLKQQLEKKFMGKQKIKDEIDKTTKRMNNYNNIHESIESMINIFNDIIQTIENLNSKIDRRISGENEPLNEPAADADVNADYFEVAPSGETPYRSRTNSTPNEGGKRRTTRRKHIKHHKRSTRKRSTRKRSTRKRTTKRKRSTRKRKH